MEMDISFLSKSDKLDIIEKAMKYWTDYGNTHMDNCDVDIYEKLDDLNRLKQDIIFGTNSYNSKQIRKQILEKRSELEEANIFKRTQIKKELSELYNEFYNCIIADKVDDESNIVRKLN